MRRATCMTMLSPTEALRERPGAEARLLPGSPPPTVSPGPPSGDGRSKDYMRQHLCRSALREGRKPLIRTVPAGQGKAPGSDQFRRPGETPGNAGKGAVMPISDPALSGGESKLPSPSAVERRRSTENPHTTPSTLPSSRKVWEKRRTVADATGLGAGITAFLRNSHGPSIASPPPPPSLPLGACIRQKLAPRQSEFAGESTPSSHSSYSSFPSSRESIPRLGAVSHSLSPSDSSRGRRRVLGVNPGRGIPLALSRVEGSLERNVGGRTCPPASLFTPTPAPRTELETPPRA